MHTFSYVFEVPNGEKFYSEILIQVLKHFQEELGSSPKCICIQSFYLRTIMGIRGLIYAMISPQIFNNKTLVIQFKYITESHIL
jgi:hypothetical protein